jgi:hypothetical protein
MRLDPTDVAGEDIDDAKVMISMMRRGWGDEHSAFTRAFSTLSCRTVRWSKSKRTQIWRV